MPESPDYWFPNYYSDSVLQTLEPGYYLTDNPDLVMRVAWSHEKPGSTLEERLAQLHVLKPGKFKRVAPPPKGVRPMQRFGVVTSVAEIKRLVAWARKEPRSQYGLAGFPYRQRERSELIIKPLA